MANDIKATSIYSELDFRINKKAFKELQRFENRIDSVKRKLAGLKNLNNTPITSPSINPNLNSTNRAQKTAIAKLSESKRVMEAFIESAEITFKNKLRAVKIPKEEVDAAVKSFHALGDEYRRGKLLKVEFTKETRKLTSGLSDMHKQLNKPKPKYTREMNAGWVSQIVKVAKAQDQLNRNIAVKEDQFSRTVRNLGNLRPDQIAEYKRKFEGFVAEVKAAPWTINRFRTQVAHLDSQMRMANSQTTFFTEQLRRMKTTLKAGVLPAIAAVTVGIVDFGRKLEQNNVLFKAAFGSEAAREMSYLRQESDRLGISLLDNVKAYSKIAFSLKLMNIEGAQAKEVFSAFSEASIAFGMSQDDLNRAFKAVEQMYSKGTVQAKFFGLRILKKITRKFS